MKEAVPTDIRLMQAATQTILAAAGMGALAVAIWAAARHPALAIQKIVVTGETQHNSVPTLRANVLPRLEGNFFTLNLHHTQRSFEQVPWVRTASVQRDFPNRLRVHLLEHKPAAHFGVDGDSNLVNSFGELFVANTDDLSEDLPRLIGPEAQTLQMLRMHQALKPHFAAFDLEISQLELSARGSWRALLDNEASVELGRGEEAVVVQATRRFLDTLARASAQLGRTPQDLEFADLRYTSGYAIRLRGISTQAPAPTSAR